MTDPARAHPGTVPAWAREAIAQTAREHPEHLAYHLGHVAEIEAARQHAAGHQPAPPVEPRDVLHLAAIRAWQALASGQPAPDPDPDVLQQAINEAFVTSDGQCPVDQLSDDWLRLARRCGIPVLDEHGDLRPDVLDAISQTVAAAIWFGITTGYLTLTRPLPYPPQAPAPLAWARQIMCCTGCLEDVAGAGPGPNG